jgi:hypothetical protein
VTTEKLLPILTSAIDKNLPTTGTKIHDYFFVQNELFLIPGTYNMTKAFPQKGEADGRIQFDKNQVYVGPDRITNSMLISAPYNIKQAIGNVLIELERDVHQIQYKPTQRKNSKAEKMFSGVPPGLCPERIMRSVQHALKKCEKAFCDTNKSIDAIMSQYHQPLPMIVGTFQDGYECNIPFPQVPREQRASPEPTAPTDRIQ